MRRFLLPVLAFSLISAACSSGGVDDEVASLAAGSGTDEVVVAGDEEVDREEAILAFAQCLRDEGLEVDDPEVGTNGEIRLPRPSEQDEGDREAMQVAREACSEYLEGVEIGLEQRDTTEFADMFLDYAACMRENGYDMPDPDLDSFQPGSGQGGGPLSGVDRDDPAFVAADEVCRVIFTEAGFAGRGGGGGVTP